MNHDEFDEILINIFLLISKKSKFINLNIINKGKILELYQNHENVYKEVLTHQEHILEYHMD